MRDSATAMRGSPTCSRWRAGACSQVPQITRIGRAAPRITSSGISASQTGRSRQPAPSAGCDGSAVRKTAACRDPSGWEHFAGKVPRWPSGGRPFADGPARGSGLLRVCGEEHVRGVSRPHRVLLWSGRSSYGRCQHLQRSGGNGCEGPCRRRRGDGGPRPRRSPWAPSRGLRAWWEEWSPACMCRRRARMARASGIVGEARWAGSGLEGAHGVRSPSASGPASPPPAATASARTTPCPGGPCG